MKHSETRKEIMAALFAARKQFPKIVKDKEGQAGHRQFKYAPLEKILEAVEPILEAHDLMLTQGPDGHNVTTLLEHIPSGEWREASMPMNTEHANMQSCGIEITYRRRYSVQMVLGIVTEEDTDGAGMGKRKGGADFTRNENGTGRIEGISTREVAWRALQPEIQDSARQCAKSVTAAMPDAAKAYDLAEMWCDSQEDPMAAKAGLAYLLDSKTNSALKKHSQQQAMAKAVRKADGQAA